MKNYHMGVELKDLFGKKRMKEMRYDLMKQESKSSERIAVQEEIIKSQATVIKMMCNELRSYKNDTIAENEKLKDELSKALSMQNSLKEYAESLEQRLNRLGLREAS